MNLDYTGILGVLLLAKELGLIQFVKPYLEKIVKTDFRISQTAIQKVLELAEELE